MMVVYCIAGAIFYLLTGFAIWLVLKDCSEVAHDEKDYLVDVKPPPIRFQRMNSVDMVSCSIFVVTWIILMWICAIEILWSNRK